MPGWVSEQDVLDELGLLTTGDNSLTRCIAAAENQIEIWRADIADFSALLATHPSVYLAGVQYSCLLYQSKITPEGFSGFEEAGGVLSGSDMQKYMQVLRLARAKMPKCG